MPSGPPSMTSLRELQTRVMHAVLRTASESSPIEAVLGLIDTPVERAVAGLEVYRNTAHVNHVDALHSTYPAVWRLVGADYFRQTAREYLGLHPSRSGDLQHVGASFATFLGERHGRDQFQYLADVARFEWLVQEALLAPDHPPLDLQKLAAVAPADHERVGFDLHPALRLFESQYPVHRIWEVNVGSEAEPEVLDLNQGGDRLAMLRRGGELEFHALSDGEWRLLRALERGTTFAAAADAAAAAEGGSAEFDATLALQRFVALGIIVDCRLAT